MEKGVRLMLHVRQYLADQAILGRPPGSSAPLVSVILPTFRRRKLLGRAITSVLAQTFKDFELLVMDDGSTDGSSDVIEEFRKRDPRVVHVRHDRNCGLPALRVNEGIQLACGKYLAFQFDDDLWDRNALKALVSEAIRHSEPVVVVGHCRRERATESVLPYVELNLINLYHQNRLANNTVLFDRCLIEKYGMYDCHIGMRRLCDWDLWLRYIKHVPFVVIDDVISQVFDYNPDSIGVTVPWDPLLFRYLHAISRDHLLTPDRWRDYEVDGLRIGDVEIQKDFRRRLYEEHFVPYYLKFRHSFPELEGFCGTFHADCKTVLMTKAAYDVSNDVALNHYDRLTNRRGTCKTYFQPLNQVTPDWTKDADALLLVRTVEDHAKTLCEQALRENKPVGFYLDDDLLNFHEFGPQFDYLKPGTPYYQNLSEMLRKVDTAWVTSPFIGESVQLLNPRTIPHNVSLPQAWLPPSIRPRSPGQPFRIGYAGSGYRLDEFGQIWEALLRLSREFKEQLSFEFWGLDIRSLPPLSSPVVQRPFTFSYFYYLDQLKQAAFDILLTPLLDHPRPRLGKSLIKYYETAMAGALGIFSDVPQYERLIDGLTCLKTENTVEGWYRTLNEAITMPPDRFDSFRRRALEHVREEFTEVAQIHLHEAAWRATEFHARTRASRYSDGRPRVVYFIHSAVFGGGELQLWRRLRLARRYGIEPIVALMNIIRDTEGAQSIRTTLAHEKIQLEFVEFTVFTAPLSPAEYWNEMERKNIRELLERCKPALVHSVTFIPSVGQICTEMNIPHVASLYAVDETFAWVDGRPDFRHCTLVQSDSLRYAARWSELLGVEKLCCREVVPEEVFTLGQTRYLHGLSGSPQGESGGLRLVVSGTFQERKRQLETIEAIGRLRREGLECQLDLYGYTHFFPQYMEKCRQCIRAYGLEDRVRFCEFNADVVEILRSADVVLSLSTIESFPSTIKEAMAGGVLVVATPIGGISELIVDGVSGVLCSDTSIEGIVEGIRRALALAPSERRRMVEQARRVARSEFHPQRAASDLLGMYNHLLKLAQCPSSVSIQPAVQSIQVLVSEAPSRQGIVESPPRPPASHLLIDGKITHRLRPQHSNWTGLDVLIGTHRRPASGRLRLRILSEAQRDLLRETFVDLALVRDNDWLELRFPPIANSASVPFVLEFTLMDRQPDTRVSLYESNPPERKYRRFFRRAGLRLSGNSLYCRTWFTS